jgi:hypothetical protein
MSLAKQIRLFKEQQESRLRKETVDLALAIIDAVAEATPVDTGRARSNWKAKEGGPDSVEIEPHHPGNHLGRGETANLAGTMEAARASLRDYRQGDIYITNNVDYIKDLDKGSSRQSAGDFQGVAEAAASAALKRGG